MRLSLNLKILSALAATIAASGLTLASSEAPLVGLCGAGTLSISGQNCPKMDIGSQLISHIGSSFPAAPLMAR